MKLFRKIWGIVLAAALVGLAVWIWSARYQQFKPDAAGESPDQRLARWRSTAQATMLTQATNDVVGFSRLVNSGATTFDDNLQAWSGDVTADFVNRAGGIDRTNMHYVFRSSEGELRCSQAGE